MNSASPGMYRHADTEWTRDGNRTQSRVGWRQSGTCSFRGSYGVYTSDAPRGCPV